jgi:hypothetical protein
MPSPLQAFALRKLQCAAEFDPDASGNQEHEPVYNAVEYLQDAN